MSEVREIEEQKVTFPEIRDYPDEGGAAVQYAPAEEIIPEAEPAPEAGRTTAAGQTAAVEKKPADGQTPKEDPAADEGTTIDVDIDNMVWEVESEPAPENYRESQAPQSVPRPYSNHGRRTGRRVFEEYEEIPYSRSINKHIYTWVFSLVCGMYGVDRMARGQVGLGIIKLLTGGGFGLWYLADLGIAVYKSYLEPDAMMQDDLHFDEYGRYV